MDEAKLPFDAVEFRAALRAWYRKNGRDLPWRKTRDPYATLVSEFMLQQTQVATVLAYFERWLRRFPDFESVARATEDEVLRAWQGLGYYSRARNLHAAAKIIGRNFRGSLPQTIEELQQLPGVGRYTANAIASFAFDQAVPIVETNVARVIARLFNFQIAIDTSAGRQALWKNAAQLLPQHHAREHNSALMDLGATICAARNPRCNLCPIRNFCCAIDPHLLPIKKAAPPLLHLRENHSFLFSRGRILLEKSTERWRGMWMLPRLFTSARNKKPLHVSQFSFTHHRVTLALFATSNGTRASKSQRWFHVRDLHAIAIPSPHRRALKQLLKEC